MRTRVLASVFAVTVIGAIMLVPGPASAGSVIIVHEGESIQEAIDGAEPGSTIVVQPGTYRENLEITTAGIQLAGSGATENGTVLEPPAAPVATDCGPNEGICLFGGPSGFVQGVHVSGFLVRDFTDGIIGIGVGHAFVDHNLTVDNEEYGIACFVCRRNTYFNNVMIGDGGEAGLYQGDSSNVDSNAFGNEATGYSWGFFMRDSSGGRVHDNVAHDNCVGFLFLNTGFGTGNSNWIAEHNQAYHNDRFCPSDPEEGSPNVSGIGIALLGTTHDTVRLNRVWDNVPSDVTDYEGGISLNESFDPGGNPIPENDNLIQGNIAYGNQPVDVFWDRQGTGNTFDRNACGASDPQPICGG
jgi:hypothetical protein